MEKDLLKAVPVQINGERTSMSKLEACASSLSNQAIKGNVSAGRQLLRVLERLQKQDEHAVPLTPEEEALLERMLGDE